MNKVYEYIMLSNPLDDEDRFRKIFDDAIASSQVEGYKAYVKETKKSRQARMKNARFEAKEAEEYAKELGVADQLSKRGKSKAEGEDALKALIMGRQKARGDDFLANLEAKYGGGSQSVRNKPKKQSKRRAIEEEDEEEAEDAEDISEAAFQAAAARLKQPSVEGTRRMSKRTKR